RSRAYASASFKLLPDNSVSLYVNGNFQGNFIPNSQPILSTDGLRIGRPTHTGGQFFKGSIDEFRFWNVAIYPANHAAWMNKELTSAHPEYANLIAYFKFNNGALLTDSKGNHIATNYGCMTVNESFPACSYLWSGPNGFTSSSQNFTIPGFTSNKAGMYFVNYTTSDGCRSQATYRDIALAPAPPAPAITSNSPVCQGSTLNLQAITRNSECIALNGASQYVSIANATNLQTPGDFTYEMWVNPVSFSGYNTYFENGNLANNNGLLLRQDSPTTIGLYISTGSQSGYTTSTLSYAPPTGSWTHLALVRSGGTLSLYANSTSVGNFTSNTIQNLSTDGLRIGRSAHTTGQYFKGSIDEFRFWKVAVIQSNLASWMNKEVDPSHPNYTNLVAYYKFNKGQEMVDSKGAHVATNYSCSFATGIVPLGSTYNWKGPNNFVSSFQNPVISFIPTANAGVYSVTATGMDGCISATGSVTVTINSGPAPIITGNSPVTAGSTLNLSSSSVLVPGNGSVGLNGTNQYIQVGNATDLRMPGDFTYEMWVYPTSYDIWRTYFDNGNYATLNDILLRQDIGMITLCINGGPKIQLNYAPPQNQWTHLALVRSGGIFSLYANAIKVGDFPTFCNSPLSPVAGLYIGRANGLAQYFKGNIDEFRFWKVAVPQATLAAWLNQEVTASHPNYSSLVAYYKFNTGQLLTDSKGTHTTSAPGSYTANSTAVGYSWLSPSSTLYNTQNVSIPGFSTYYSGNWNLKTTAPTGCYSSGSIMIMLAKTVHAPAADTIVNSITELVDPDGFYLGDCIPNPVTSNADISYYIPYDGKVVMKLYNVQGSCVATFVDENRPKGRYTVTVNKGNFAEGIYYYKLEVFSEQGNLSAAKKLIMLK
ncbi:MAG: LamG-like jellyroll fold domain-containing protein, partial [Bacteroidota bacterium]